MADANESGIYAILAPSGKRYIGSAVNFARRWKDHKRRLRKGGHHCKPLQAVANKHGVSALVFYRVETCAPGELLTREQFHIDTVPAARRLNGRPLAQSNLGVKFGPFSKERKRAHSAALKGHNVSPEARAKIGATHRGRKHTDASRANMAKAHVGKSLPECVRKKIGAKRNKSGHTGVCWYARSSKWVCYVTRGKHRKTIGYFEDIEDAVRARNAYLTAWERTQNGQ